MGRDNLKVMKCGACGKEFSVATEDLEWEHLTDCGETDDDPSMRDYSISQDLVCPSCGRKNKVMVNFRGKSSANLDLKSVSIVNFSAFGVE